MRVQSFVDAIRSSSASPEEEPSAEVAVDELFAILRTNRRSLSIRYLPDDVESGEVVTTRELSKFIARCENGVEECSSAEYKAVYVTMLQTHLSRLVDAGLAKKVDQHDYRPGPNLEAAVEVLETAESVTGGEA